VSGEIGDGGSSGAGVEYHISLCGIRVWPGDPGHAVGGAHVYVHSRPGGESEGEIVIGLKAIIESGRGRRRGSGSFPGQVHVISVHGGGEVVGRIDDVRDFGNGDTIQIEVEHIGGAVALEANVVGPGSGRLESGSGLLIGGIGNVAVAEQLIGEGCGSGLVAPEDREGFRIGGAVGPVPEAQQVHRAGGKLHGGSDQPVIHGKRGIVANPHGIGSALGRSGKAFPSVGIGVRVDGAPSQR